MTDTGLNILYRDEHFIAVDKPTGMVVHRTRIATGAPPLLQKLRDQIGQRVYPVHRLDRPTSGVIVFGRTPEVASALGRQSQDDAMDKTYLALVRGWADESGVIDHPVPRRKGGPKVPALSRYRTLEKVQTQPREVSLVQVTITRGRTHQVRRHMRHVNHPVIGDTNYGENRLNRQFASEHALARLALHASTVTLTHPRTGEAMTFTAPLPDDLTGPLRSMGFALSCVDSLGKIG